MNIEATPWTWSQSSPGFEIVLDSVASAGWTARRHLDELGALLPASTLYDTRTVVTELVDNSVRHGTGRPIAVLIEVTPGGVTRGSVSDGGSGPVEIAVREASEGGLGLRIVDALVSRWGVSAPSSDVWFELAPA
jgi:two-component sensor histidine kinase